MPEVHDVWSQALPTIKQGVTGVGVWAALNSATPIVLEDGTFVLGVRPGESELAGHLRMPATKKLIEQEVSRVKGSALTVRIIDGTGADDWERVKRRDLEAKRLQEVAQNKVRAEIESRSSWDSIYEQLGRKFAATPNKSLPQNRAKFFNEAVGMVAEAYKQQPTHDELNERNFARCIERLAQYAEIPASIVAIEVLKKVGPA